MPGRIDAHRTPPADPSTSLSNKLVDGGASSPATSTPLQFPLKCFAFPGAETARKQFLLRGSKLPYEGIATNPAYTPPDSIEARQGCSPDALSRVLGSLASPMLCIKAWVMYEHSSVS